MRQWILTADRGRPAAGRMQGGVMAEFLLVNLHSVGQYYFFENIVGNRPRSQRPGWADVLQQRGKMDAVHL